MKIGNDAGISRDTFVFYLENFFRGPQILKIVFHLRSCVLVAELFVIVYCVNLTESKLITRS